MIKKLLTTTTILVAASGVANAINEEVMDIRDRVRDSVNQKILENGESLRQEISNESTMQMLKITMSNVSSYANNIYMKDVKIEDAIIEANRSLEVTGLILGKESSLYVNSNSYVNINDITLIPYGGKKMYLQLGDIDGYDFVSYRDIYNNEVVSSKLFTIDMFTAPIGYHFRDIDNRKITYLVARNTITRGKETSSYSDAICVERTAIASGDDASSKHGLWMKGVYRKTF